MNKKIFLDTNLLVYLFSSDEPDKRDMAIKTVTHVSCITGINNISELTNVLIKKFRVPYNDVLHCIDQVTQLVKVVDVTIDIIKAAVKIADRYSYSYYDSLVISNALANQCSLLYSEDMQHQQLVNGTLTIVDIFQM